MIKINIESILNDCNIEFHQTHKHYVLKTCPNCGGSKRLSIAKDSYLWQCWKCRGLGQDETSRGNLLTFLKKVLYLDNVQVNSILKNNEIITYTENELPVLPISTLDKVEEKRTVPKIDLPTSFFPLDCSIDSVKNFPEVYQYLINRFVNSKDIIKSFRLRYDAAKKRLVFPAYIESNFCVGYQARDITDRWKSNFPKCPNYKCSMGKHYYFNTDSVPINCPVCQTEIEDSFYPKSVNSIDFPKTEFFFNQQNVNWAKPVVLTEGPFDCINTPNSIGLLGRYLSDTQFHILLDKQPELIMYLDGDSAGTQMNQEIYYKLNIFMKNIKFIYLEDGDDPGSHNLIENENKIKEALNPIDWFQKKKLFYL